MIWLLLFIIVFLVVLFCVVENYLWNSINIGPICHEKDDDD